MGGAQELGPMDVGTDIVAATAVGSSEVLVQTRDGQIVTCDPSSCRATHKVLLRDPDLDTSLVYAHSVAADAMSIYYSAVDAKDADGGGARWRIMRLAR